jgi:hypothetical protein
VCVQVVTPLSMGQSTSSTSWYITHTILTYSLRSINVNLMTIIATQRPSYPRNNHHYGTTTSSIEMAYPCFEQDQVICASALKNTTQVIDAVSSRSVFTEGLAAVEKGKTKHDKSTLHLYTNIKFYTAVRGVSLTRDPVSKSDYDIESWTLRLRHRRTST